MPVSTTQNRYSFTGNGATTVFAYPSKFLADADLVVIERNTTTGVETVKTLTTHYTVTGAGAASGGSVTMLIAPAAGTTLAVYGDPAATQALDMDQNAAIPVASLEYQLDKHTLLAQRVKDLAARSFRLKEGYTATFDGTLPSLLVADSTIVINATGDGFDLGPTTTGLTADVAAAAASAAAAAASEAAAAASQAAAATSATNAANSATSASTSATAADTSEANAAASAAAAAASEAAAAASAAAAGTAVSLGSYADDAAFVTANGAAVNGDIYYNTTSNRARYFKSGVWTVVADAADTATLTTDVATVTTGLSDHLADAVGAHAATAVSFTPAGTIAATTVQAAVEEVASEAATNLSNHTGDAVAAHAASAVSVIAQNGIAATEVQAALEELQAEITALVGGSTPPLQVVTKTADYTTVLADDVILVNAESGPVIITILAAATLTKAQRVKKIDDSTNPVTIEANAAETVDDEPSIELNLPNEAVTLISDGGNLHVF